MLACELLMCRAGPSTSCAFPIIVRYDIIYTLVQLFFCFVFGTLAVFELFATVSHFPFEDKLYASHCKMKGTGTR